MEAGRPSGPQLRCSKRAGGVSGEGTVHERGTPAARTGVTDQTQGMLTSVQDDLQVFGLDIW